MSRLKKLSGRKANEPIAEAVAPPAAVTAQLDYTLTQRSRLGQLLHDWQELIVWLPALLLALVVLFVLLPRLDPRSGIDGFGDVFALVKQLVVLAVIWFATWLAKRTYFTELDEDAERDLLQRLNKGDLSALPRLIYELLVWVVIACVVVRLLS